MLYLVATPIGNLEDVSLRALRILREADVIVAEDTRRTGILLRHYQIIHKPMISFYEEVEKQKIDEILEHAQDKAVALVSDSGTPLISDPGYKLVREALKKGIKVEAIPGPTAAILALILSGLPPDKFLFLGYPPEKESHQQQLFTKIKKMPIRTTIIFYVSPYKLPKFLKGLKGSLGDLEIIVARELTKIHQEIWRGKVSRALVYFSRPKGEFVVLWHS